MEGANGRAEIAASDPAELGALQDFLVLTAPGVIVRRIPGQPDVGEQGALDWLEILAGSSGVVAAVRMLPEFVRSRRSDFTITTTVNGRPFALNAANIDEVMPILDRLLDA